MTMKISSIMTQGAPAWVQTLRLAQRRQARRDLEKTTTMASMRMMGVDPQLSRPIAEIIDKLPSRKSQTRATVMTASTTMMMRRVALAQKRVRSREETMTAATEFTQMTTLDHHQLGTGEIGTPMALGPLQSKTPTKTARTTTRIISADLKLERNQEMTRNLR